MEWEETGWDKDDSEITIVKYQDARQTKLNMAKTSWNDGNGLQSGTIKKWQGVITEEVYHIQTNHSTNEPAAKPQRVLESHAPKHMSKPSDDIKREMETEKDHTLRAGAH